MDINKSTSNFIASDSGTWPPLLNIQQVASILNVIPWTLRQWDKKGKLQAIRIGARKDRRYKKEDILIAVEKGLA
ncbi:MAG: MerR family transcriptional regulator [Pseudomonadota bacterium]|nr:MerR family transcriptional regulator [Pseudomonadota bacterium]